jgi:phosphoribosyl-ATP pyrophosphohydrolase/phosphoribosyl-AMP cyclohydrolase
VAWLTGRRPETAGGLLPAIVQDAGSGEVLMLAWVNDEALAATGRTGFAHFWSRSRDELWRKGATSGNVMRVVDLTTDCDGDAVLFRVSPAGPACHTGARSCFADDAGEPGLAGEPAEAGGDGSSPPADPRFDLHELARLIESRRSADPATSYTARLLQGGTRRAGEKVVEEAGELVGAALAGSDDEVRAEAADLAYHLLVLLATRGIPLAEVEAALRERRA